MLCDDSDFRNKKQVAVVDKIQSLVNQFVNVRKENQEELKVPVDMQGPPQGKSPVKKPGIFRRRMTPAENLRNLGFAESGLSSVSSLEKSSKKTRIKDSPNNH